MNMTATDQELLGQFTREQSQDAFSALVERHVNLVYSAALRQVQSPDLAEEVSQTVFTQLATHADSLKPGTVLTAWLYQVARHAAVDLIRREARRRVREQIAVQMTELNDNSIEWRHIEPLLDEAMQSLDEADRTAVLLRYFENKPLRAVGEALGTSEDAAQKRVSRAVDQLRDFFSKRKITVGAAGLAALLSANAVQAAPAGLALALAGAAAAAAATGTALTTATVTTAAKTIAMTTLQKSIFATALAAAVVTAFYQTHKVAQLRDEVQTLQGQQQQLISLSNQLHALEQERDHATNAAAAVVSENEALKKHPTEVLKLRGEVGRLRTQNAEMGATNALSKATANPETRKLLRDQQKAGMGMLYKTFTKDAKLTKDQTEKLNDLLADHIMDNVDLVTTALRDKPSAEQLNDIFSGQDAALRQKLQDVLGPDALAKYQEYTKNLIGTVSAEQFKEKLTGDAAVKTEKSKQLSQLILEETSKALTEANLPPDYQVIPMLNFRNIASEKEGERSLTLLDNIYQRAAARCDTFLSAEEIASLQEFRAKAIQNNRGALALNRAIMAPINN
jgi:RNA polymerase sigma factor (sigma-70 family)